MPIVSTYHLGFLRLMLQAWCSGRQMATTSSSMDPSWAGRAAPRCAGLRCLTALAQLLPGLGTPKAQPGCLLTWPARASVALALAASAAVQLSSPPWTPILKLRKNLENQRHRKARPRSAENRQVIWVQAAEQCWCHVQLRLNTKDTASSLLVEADGPGVVRAAREQLGSEFGAQWQRAA